MVCCSILASFWCSSTIPEKQTLAWPILSQTRLSQAQKIPSLLTHTQTLITKPHSCNENTNLLKWQQAFLWIKDRQFPSHSHMPAFQCTGCRFLKLSETTAWSFLSSCHKAAGSRFDSTFTSPSVQSFVHLLTFTLKQPHEDAHEKGHPYYAVRTLALLFITFIIQCDKRGVHLPWFIF